jgi:NAD-dependent DNA ligase|uniref:DNA ligase (NAD(+)) n=1 Tax=viral metagenome TaxID=1070528 RepID=A0A6C0IFZ9_9ZZZZ
MSSKKVETKTRKNNSTSKMNKLSEDPVNYLKTKTNDEIADILRKASFEYYKGTPIITDDIFDIVKDYLEKKDPTNPVLKEIGAPTYGEKVDLPYWMGSLDKIRENEASLDKWKEKHPGKCVISEKLDGNSALLVVKDKTFKLYSRGDGIKGQDISHLIPLIAGMPDALPGGLAVRGELIIKKVDWIKLHAKGKGANARNAVAGVMHSKKPDPELAAATRFVAYEQLHPRVKMSESLEALEKYKFKVVHNTIMNRSDLSMETLSNYLMKRREKSLYEMDGIVVYHDAEHNQISGKNPSYAFAFKSLLTHEEAEVIVKEVEWNASKDGFLKPIIKFDPVTIAGVSIQKATGFNAQYIEKNVIGPGSRIVIIRSGDVIPHVHKILSKSANEKPSLPQMEFEWNDTHVDIILKHTSDDKDVMVKRIIYFTKTLEMKGVGPGIVERLYTNGINTFKKFIHVSVEELLKMEGFQKKSAEKVVSEIHESVKNADCLTLMTASNLFGRSIAEKKLKLILEAFPEIQIPTGKKPTESELSNISGVGEVTAKQFLEGLPLFFDFMKELGLNCKVITLEKVVVPKGKSLEELIVVFTGVRDKELEQEIEARGGKVGSSVSSKTKVLVAKDPSEDSGKIKTAKELGIPVVSLETFKKNYM